MIIKTYYMRLKKKNMKKRLVKKSEKYIPNIGDTVIFKNHPYDFLPYKITGILPNGTVFMENETDAYTGIHPSKIQPLQL